MPSKWPRGILLHVEVTKGDLRLHIVHSDGEGEHSVIDGTINLHLLDKEVTFLIEMVGTHSYKTGRSDHTQVLLPNDNHKSEVQRAKLWRNTDLVSGLVSVNTAGAVVEGSVLFVITESTTISLIEGWNIRAIRAHS